MSRYIFTGGLVVAIFLAGCGKNAPEEVVAGGIPRAIESDSVTTFIHNPVLPGFNPDPSIIRADEDYFIATSSFEWFPGIPLYHSKDLAHWRPIGHALTRPSQADLRGIPPSAGIYAPSLHYNEGRVYLVYTIVQTDERAWPLFATPNYLIRTDDIYGAWSDPVYLNSVGFDPSLFFDDDGKTYTLSMVMDFRKSEPTMGKIALQEVDIETGQPLGEMKIILNATNLWGTEGPHLYKKGGYYYLLVAQGGTFYEHAATIARSDHIEGPYELAPNTPFMTSQTDSTLRLQRAGHGCLVETPSGDWYMAHLASRSLMPERKSPLGRESCLQRVEWTEGGWLQLAQGGVKPADSIPAPALPAVAFEDIPARDEFDGRNIRVDYQTLREPHEKNWLDLQSRPGMLRLRGRRPPSSHYDVSLVARRVTSYAAEAETAVEFHPESYRHKAGLAAFYDSRHYYWLAVSHDDSLGRCVELLGFENGRYQEYARAAIEAEGAAGLRFKVSGR
ncbi:MAG: glycoside hydrolase family 43 protein, partial [Lewinellaceae bacterium]|nr:glycoside hydrolase family 43 protein [Lewinellaceae bacterium]